MQLNTYVSVSSLWLTEKNIIEFSIWNGHKTSDFRGSISPFFCFHLLVHWSMCSEILWLKSLYLPVWPDLAIYWTLGNFSKPLAKINWPKSLTFRRQLLCRCQNISFFKWNHFWATFIDIWRFFSGHTANLLTL